MCAGMTGGTLYLRLQPELNLDLAALQRRIARGAEVDLRPVDASDDLHLHEMLHLYADELIHNHQVQTAECAVALLDGWEDRFVKIVPRKAD